MASEAFSAFISVWHMPLLFFLAGCSTYFALRKRSGGQYAWERVKRLLVPLVFGIFILIPPQTWYGGRFNSGYTGSYWHYLVSGDFLRWNIQDGGDYFGGFGIGQLWFIMFLLFMSLIALPLVLWGARGRGVAPDAGLLPAPGPAGLVAPAPSSSSSVGGIVPEIPGGPFVYYLFIFILGFVAVCDPKFMESAERYRIPALVAGVGVGPVLGAERRLPQLASRPVVPRAGLSILGNGRRSGWSSWALLGFGKRYLDRTSRTQKYLAEGSYPVYILHQTVIVIIGFYVIRWAAPRPVLWVILLVAAVLGRSRSTRSCAGWVCCASCSACGRARRRLSRPKPCQ